MINVLMLGWEFPPLFSGGLGIATYGIVKSLSSLSRIRPIIPNAASSNDLEKVKIMGLNKVGEEQIDLEKHQFTILVRADMEVILPPG